MKKRTGRPKDFETEILRYQVWYLIEVEKLSNTQAYEAMKSASRSISPEYVPKLYKEAKERIEADPEWQGKVILRHMESYAEAIEKAGYDLANPSDHPAIWRLVISHLEEVSSAIIEGVARHKRKHPRAKIPAEMRHKIQ